MEEFILALDQGTTGSTALLIDSNGNIKAKGYREITQLYPKPGWVEHDPIEIWESILDVTHQVIEIAGISPSSIKSIGITNQRETTVLWDAETSQPEYNAIVWQCRRSEEVCKVLRNAGHEKTFHDSTGLMLDPYFSGTKLVWLFENDPELRKKADDGRLKFGNIDAWLLWKLSGGTIHRTDWTNASRTLMFNTMNLEWDMTLLNILGIPYSILPEAKPSLYIYGMSDPEHFLGIEASIGGIAGDQQAALFGQTCFNQGEIKNTYGTGCFMMMNTGNKPVKSSHGLLTTAASSPLGEGTWAMEGSVFIAGAAVQWLRDGLHIIKKASETERIAKSINNTGGVYVVPAFAGLGAPYWDPGARGTIIGITGGTTSSHIVRAVLESIAYQVKDVFEAMKEDAGFPINVLKVDGGATVNDFLMQFQADLLGIPVDRPAQVESTGIGAGYLAGLSIGFWKDSDEILGMRKSDKIFEPHKSRAEMDALYSGWLKAVERTRSEIG